MNETVSTDKLLAGTTFLNPSLPGNSAKKFETTDNGDKTLYPTEFPNAKDPKVKEDSFASSGREGESQTTGTHPVCPDKEFQIGSKLFNPKALQYGYRTGDDKINLPPSSFYSPLKVRENGSENKVFEVDFDSINVEKHRYAYGYKHEVHDYSKLTTEQKLITNDPTNPRLLYPNQRVGYNDYCGFAGYQEEKYTVG